MALIIILSVFNGFEDLVKSLYGTFNPDLKVEVVSGKTFTISNENFNKIEDLEGVMAVSQVLEELALLKYKEKRTVATIKGVDAAFTQVSEVDTSMRTGDFILKDGPMNFAIVGWGIEYDLGVNVFNSIEPLQIFMPKRTAKASINPENLFTVKSIMPTGSFSVQEEFDRKYVFVPLEFAQNLMNYTTELSALEIAFTENADQNETQQQIQAILGENFTVKNRFEQDEFLYKVMQTEKWAVYLILILVLIIASFNIVGSISMLVIEKSKDVGVLRAMGADNGLIRAIFLAEGSFLSIGGGILGIILGFVVCWLQQQFGLVKLGGASFLLEAYPVSMRVEDFVMVLFTILIIALLASFYPAMKAASNKTIRVN